MYSPHARDALCEVMAIGFLTANSQFTPPVQAYRRGIYYPKYAIITFGWYVRQWWKMDAPSTNCTAEERERVLVYSTAAVSSQFPREYDDYHAEPNIVNNSPSSIHRTYYLLS